MSRRSKKSRSRRSPSEPGQSVITQAGEPLNEALEAYFAAVESEQTNWLDVAGLAVALVLCVWAVS